MAPAVLVALIALTAFTDDESGTSYVYGQEFKHEEGAKVEQWKKEGKVRVDDRMPRAPTPVAPADAPASPATTRARPRRTG